MEAVTVSWSEGDISIQRLVAGTRDSGLVPSQAGSGNSTGASETSSQRPGLWGNDHQA